MKDLNSTGIKPLVLDEIIEIAKKYKVEKVILFGSRARGDHTRASDIDLAVSGGDMTGFTLDVKETTSTLLDFDVVDLNSPVQKELLTSIYKEGIVLYEKI
ncbi:MAG: nucleotidyltransferase domain-containing protein [Blautia sp.]|nr:nucleotidyltransferase domain-containing protein [Blautia sp.]